MFQLRLFCLFILINIIASCSKETISNDNTSNNGTGTGTGSSSGSGTALVDNVYVAGDSVVNGNSFPVIWKNGIITNLPTGNYSYGHANSIFVISNNIFVAGYISNGNKQVAALWKNGVLINLSNCPNGEAKSVYVSGSDVYVAGVIDTAALGSIAMPRAILWKNYAPSLIWPSYWQSNANSVFITPSTLYPGTNDVYVTGKANHSNGHSAFLVKNGVPLYGGGNAPDLYTGLNNMTNSNSIFVTASDIYMSGSYASGSGSYPLLWKNGNEIMQIGGNSVFVSGSDVYVAGGSLYKNGVVQSLSNLTGIGSGVQSVYVLGVNVYVCGATFGSTVRVPTYWKNGIPVVLTKDHNGYAYSIFVTS